MNITFIRGNPGGTGFWLNPLKGFLLKAGRVTGHYLGVGHEG